MLVHFSATSVPSYKPRMCKATARKRSTRLMVRDELLPTWLKVVGTLQSMCAAWLFDGPQDLLASREDRRHWAEERIRVLVWGTDGSMIPASASLCESRRVTAAVTGPTTLVVQLNGRNLSILHGELMGHILALVLRSNADPTVIPTLYSDHQNSVDLIEDIQTRVSQGSRLRGMNGRSYYHWILALARERRVNMLYTRGHSAELSLPSQLNREADHYASGSQRFPELVPIAPTPTFTMDAYTLYTKADG
ncbi:hypothetical protein B0H13DRAFT_2353269 [Mycena leptocephala]|nr:hypothetical protein B0H13DRAFT_2353269 [Mycena leptocephala]